MNEKEAFSLKDSGIRVYVGGTGERNGKRKCYSYHLKM